MLICMVILGGMGSIPGVIAGGIVITLFDRIFLTQMTNWTRALGGALGIDALTKVDFTLWRWVFFELGLVIMLILKPGGSMAAGRGGGVAPRHGGGPGGWRGAGGGPLPSGRRGAAGRRRARLAARGNRPPRAARGAVGQALDPRGEGDHEEFRGPHGPLQRRL